VRPGQEMNAGGAHRRKRSTGGDPQPGLAAQHPCKQQGRRGADGHRGECGHGLQPTEPVEPGKNHIRQPLPGEPFALRPGKREQVADRHGQVLQNVIAGADVPAGISI